MLFNIDNVRFLGVEFWLVIKCPTQAGSSDYSEVNAGGTPTYTTLLGLEFHFRRSNCIHCLLWIGRHRESKLRLPKLILGRHSFRSLLNFGNLSLSTVGRAGEIDMFFRAI
jgi:hypothetical protein